ncbi:MAG: NifU family protein [Calditrichaceae bacterium]|jgi:Fe-S cluster biogenesis protein NfuA
MQLQDKIMKALDSIRPGLQADGGDVEFVRVDADNVVHIKLIGACGGCPMSTITLKQGIERIVKMQVPEITSVEAV